MTVMVPPVARADVVVKVKEVEAVVGCSALWSADASSIVTVCTTLGDGAGAGDGMSVIAG